MHLLAGVDTSKVVSTPAGWYQNPENPLEERLWDGTSWTASTRPKAPVTHQPSHDPNAGRPPAGVPYGVHHETPNKTNALILAIVSTVCGCLPLGIWSIVLATQIDNHVMRGDFLMAHETAKKSRTIAWVSIGIGLALVALQILGAIAAVSPT